MERYVYSKTTTIKTFFLRKSNLIVEVHLNKHHVYRDNMLQRCRILEKMISMIECDIDLILYEFLN